MLEPRSLGCFSHQKTRLRAAGGPRAAPSDGITGQGPGHRTGARTELASRGKVWPGLWGVRMEPAVTVREGYCPHPGPSNTAWFWKALVGRRRWGRGVAAVTPASYPPSALNSKSGFCWDTLHAKAAQHLSGVTVALSSAHAAEVQLEPGEGLWPPGALLSCGVAEMATLRPACSLRELGAALSRGPP